MRFFWTASIVAAKFYVRWMQRISSLAFGTRTGRFLTRFAVVPFGGAYVALAGVHHVWEMFGGAKDLPTEIAAERTEAEPPSAAADFADVAGDVLVLGLFLLCLINSRRSAGRSALSSRIVPRLRAVVIEPIRWLIQSPWLQADSAQPAVRFLVAFRRQATGVDGVGLAAASDEETTGQRRSGDGRVDLFGGQPAVELARWDERARKWSSIGSCRAGIASACD